MTAEKSTLHPRNLHRNSYDFEQLISCVPELKHYVFVNPYGNQTINFSIPKAVKLLNKALLQHFYGIKNWDIPDENLCPPIPGRADYIHYLADLLAENIKEIPKKSSVKGLDIGTGANLVYPLIAHQSYGWKMTGTDINQKSLENAQKILDENPNFSSHIQLKFQPDSKFIFKNILSSEDKFTFSMCNPPFHDSEESAMKGNLRKTKNLNKSKIKNPKLNFSGQQSELWCEGGEIAFISNMIQESVKFSSQILWLTCLVSKKENLFKLNSLLNKVKAVEVKTIDMTQGQKISRILAWTFIPKENRKNWF
ncbi:23S rRNA (adenine(1618)-N(6))-methyltransferase RlmF [Chryseobacterium sp. Ch-15]|uniref:Ribosomal RNA large subunit methyltransferase F n=1 Tax=Chryseobacterium muglaense TaxID=2893752 RepID=A0A9Q3V0X8_9FLAO|nr:23S rRNA (adenine(1618)-N(6))-methyltransferase RlmF [Chryseobacterium muglaense]MBD3904564.1 23S rRNA (adenine(1618)-N(6))-methyltransferase RlmF [Chryseobacterium muglaense]MCC9036959.1 23S rRNA (adenine(1618)-N(6))-methyltransferase RlmF [Chryseobacterium muglaense]MCM2554342.1 23S rRNA (adenine(1618)-N(6))-methyltransferase RlmF [Chryseobacterium muglaense]